MIKQGNFKKLIRFDSDAGMGASLKESIFCDKVNILYDQNIIGMVAQIILALFLTTLLWKSFPHDDLYVWLGTMLGISVLTIATTWYRQQQVNQFSAKTWLGIFCFLTVLIAAGWGSVSLLFFPDNNHPLQMVLIILIAGIIAGSIPFLSSIVWIHALYVCLVFIPLIVRLFAAGQGAFPIGFLSLVYLPVILACAVYINNMINKALTLRYKNLNLDALNQLLEKNIHERTQDIEKSLSLTQAIMDSTADAIIAVGLKNNIEFYNQQFLNIFNLTENFMKNADLDSLYQEVSKQISLPNEFNRALKKLSTSPEEESAYEITINNDKIYEWYSKPNRQQGIIIGRVFCFRDITFRKQMAQKLIYQSTHDYLTELPNRTLLLDRIHQGIAFAKRYKTNLGLLFIDIDNFKLINDSLGHEAGDILLQKIARRLKKCTREEDTVSRFSGDEFIILFITDSTRNAAFLAQKILNNLSKPLQLQNRDIVVTASIGVSMHPKDGDDATTLIKNADMAMHLAKDLGRNNYKMYNEAINKAAKKNLDMQIQLRNAMASHEFILLYQPILDLKTNQIVAAEALVRWNHPKKGLIHPLKFIPIAEQSNIIILLGEWIFRKACLQNKAWQNQGLRPIRIAINVSGIQLVRDNFLEMIELALSDAQIKAQYVEVELTESILMDNKKQNILTLNRLNELGINLTIDDFGTGYSSLNYLRQFPVQKLKIDQSFIHDCLTVPNDATLVETIIAMGHGLKMKVLAEGVETKEQLDFLLKRDCDEAQGFLLGKPVSAEEFAKLLL